MADLQKKLTILPDNPLCGISTYKDTLNLATGDCMRQIRKLVLTGEEDIDKNTQSASDYIYYFSRSYLVGRGDVLNVKCTHLNQIPTPGANVVGINTTTNQLVVYINFGSTIMNAQPSGNTIAGVKEYLAAQYAAGTPVTIWYILGTPTTETITVPSGLSGTEEGYLNQSGTPTPTNPIYPTANNVEVWVHSLRKLGTATDTITTLPADIYTDGTNATVGLVGNMSQTGTPTPTTPIQPSECGDLSENLFDKYGNYSVGTFTNNYTITGLKPNTQYTCSTNFTKTVGTASIYFGGGSSTTNGVWANSPNTQTSTAEGTLSLSLRFGSDAGAPAIYDDVIAGTIWIMVNEGSTPLSYEPYGYKLTISSASTTTPVYLGEVQTTRKIKKLVLDGTEDWKLWAMSASSTTERFYINIVGVGANTCICSHFRYAEDNSDTIHFRFGGTNRNELLFWIDKQVASTVADFKAYLQQQYAAGTPVTVWHVLETETTGIVNEPLRKIGDYADTVSGISIPTITGKDSFDVLTTLKPSEVSLAYTGWHDATVREKSRNLFDAMAVSKGRINSSTGAIEYAEDTPTLTYSDTDNEFTITTRYAWRGFITEYLDLQEKPAFSYISDDGTFYAFFYAYDANKNYLGAITSSVPTDTKYIRVSIQCSTVVTNAKIKNIMLNTGSTALPYEPYWK